MIRASLWGPGAAIALIVGCTSLDHLNDGSDPPEAGVEASAADAPGEEASTVPCGGVTCATGATCLAGVCRCGGPDGDTCTTETPASCDGGPCEGQVVGECVAYACRRRRTLAVLENVQQIVVDEGVVYIADDGAVLGGAYRVQVGGGPVTKLAAGLPRAIAVAAGDVYWPDPTNQRIVTCPSTGCPPAGPDLYFQDSVQPITIAATTFGVLWMSFDGTIKRCGVPCTTPTSVSVGGAGRIAVTDTGVVFASNNPGEIYEWGFGSSGPTVHVTGQYQPFAIAANPYRAYWANLDAVRTAPADAGSSDATVEASLVAYATLGDSSYHYGAVAIDTGSVYWTDGTKGIFRCSLAGCGSAPDVVTTFPAAWGLAVDGTSLFFARGGAVYQIDKK